MKFRLSFVFIFLSISIYSQNLKKIDSLKNDLKNEKIGDTVTVRLLTTLVNSYMHVNQDSTLHYSNLLFKFSEDNNSDFGFYNAHYYKAFYFFTTSSIDSVIVSLEKAMSYAEKINELDYITEINLKLGGIYNRQANFEKAFLHTNNALAIAKETKNSKYIAHAYLDFGNIYFEKNELNEALIYYKRIDSIFTASNTKDFSLGNALSNTGLIFLELEDYSKAQSYFIRTKEVFEAIDYQHGIELANARLGETLVYLKEYETAIPLIKNGIAYYTKVGDKYKLADGIYSLGKAYLITNKKKLGMRKLNEALILKKEVKDSLGMSLIWLRLSKEHLINHDYNESLKSAKESLLISSELNILNGVSEAYSVISESNMNLSNYKEAYSNLNMYLKLNDSLLKIQNLKGLQELETKYESEKKAQEIILLKSQNELAEQQKSNQRNLFLGGLTLTTLAGFFFFVLYRNRKNTNTKLKELDKAKSNFFANVSHEFRTPLTLISGPIEHQLKSGNIGKEQRQSLEMVHRNANRLLGLVDQLLDISKIEAGNLKLKVTQSQMLPFIGVLADSFTFAAEEKQINYDVKINVTEQNSWFDKDALEKIIVNLISNAIKYTPSKGEIECNASINNDTFYFEIKNTGEGLTEEELKKVFQRFYQINEDKQGVGLGLTLVKELVTLHKGSITVNSKANDWTSFKIELPVGKNFFKANEINSDGVNNDLFEKTNYIEISTDENIEELSLENENQPILLIVDDNADVRTYVSSLFNKDYKILNAKDGEEGTQLAHTHIPDIIISDIMMPVKNGIELCNDLKNDERTCHIPIILLTAKTGEENELEGVKMGADDYVTKPFSEDLLLLKVQKLIENRQKLRERYSQELVLKPKGISINSVDEQFFNRVQSVLDEKLIESSFSINEFSESIGMSRMQLHRKLKALTGLTTSEFIRSQRLKLAVELLKNSEINVSQIGYSVGFNDHAYFSKCFKEVYNCTPSEFTKK